MRAELKKTVWLFFWVFGLCFNFVVSKFICGFGTGVCLTKISLSLQVLRKFGIVLELGAMEIIE